MRTDGNDAGAFALSVLLHVLVAGLAWLSSLVLWRTPPPPAAGEPIGATLEISAADLRRAEKLIEKARAAQPEPPAPPAPQPVPEPRPQDADVPLQPTPQAPLDKPDTVDQEQVVRNAITPSESPQEQQARQRQEQVDLTEDIERQRQVEERQRLREQYEAIQRERAEAQKHTRMEEQRLAQLADRAVPKPAEHPTPAPPKPRAGEGGVDEGLLARYKAAMRATAQANFNRSLATEGQPCRVRFTQIPGGEVINIEFMDCPYDAQGREAVERALSRTPMPYDEFKSVFIRQPELTFCFPEDSPVCQRR